MKGKIISYISAKKFGFICGDDGESYFLHVSSLLDKANESKLVKDVVVEFEPTETPKGLAAKQVHVPDVNFKKQLVAFFTAKSNQPRYGYVVARHTLSTRFFKDQNEGRSHIKQLAADIGCNAILNTNVEKVTFSEGGEDFTMHSFSGDFALVTEDVPCNIDTECAESVEIIEAKVTAVAGQFQRVNNTEIKAKAKQLRKSNPRLIAAGVVIVGALFALSTLSMS
ncbi:cold shock domain-containing protein [Moritella marina ATCC 15381]|uniref:Cold shock domain-containing protein n=1 Tax=Moritella marina ATCC 15381 TaxID=1202962 RepID=A0A5J6WIH5_MORMI|nr:cold shock domain-containing protein [Moritella marina]QFI37823.1 cold shock domain-containing protein [Moritella marina ATCC 15381]